MLFKIFELHKRNGKFEWFKLFMSKRSRNNAKPACNQVEQSKYGAPKKDNSAIEMNGWD